MPKCSALPRPVGPEDAESMSTSLIDHQAKRTSIPFESSGRRAKISSPSSTGSDNDAHAFAQTPMGARI